MTTMLGDLAKLAGVTLPILGNATGATFLWRIAGAVEDHTDPAAAAAAVVGRMSDIEVWDAFTDLRLYRTVDRIEGIGHAEPSAIAAIALTVTGERLAAALLDLDRQ